ncbi:hypothetical protein JTB14_011927 [Gonioctena quinquepunctata]|nr:hypothetical protein JTB14_011927 [Gonioctena quinquepunctata]
MSLSSRLVGDERVNCHMDRDIGNSALINVVGENFQNVKFKQKLQVVTLSSAVRTMNVGNKQVAVDPLTLFRRLCVLKQSDEEMQTFFNYELSPFPMSMFTQNGMGKRTKSSFYAVFTPVDNENTQGKSKFVVVDGSHLLHEVVWPKTSNTLMYGMAKMFLLCLTAIHQKLSTKERRVLNGPVIQSEEDADSLIVTIALANASDYDLVIIAGEDIDLLVIFIGLVELSRNVYFQKVSDSSCPLYSLTISAFFGKAELLTALKRNPQLKEQAAASLNPTSTPVEIEAAGKQVIVTMYGDKPGLDTPNSLRY